MLNIGADNRSTPTVELSEKDREESARFIRFLL